MGVDYVARKSAKKFRKRDAHGEISRVRKKKNQPRRLCRGPCYAPPQLTPEDVEDLPLAKREKILREVGFLSANGEDPDGDGRLRGKDRSRGDRKKSSTGLSGSSSAEKRARSMEVHEGQDEDLVLRVDAMQEGMPEPKKKKIQRKEDGSSGRKLSTDVSLIDPQKLKRSGHATPTDPTSDSLERLKLPTVFLECMKGENLTSPTPVQSRCWPILLEGRDARVVAPPGAGKTLGYALPMFSRMKEDSSSMGTPPSMPHPWGIVLVPTRELAHQVTKVMKRLSRHCGRIRIACIVGGEQRDAQVKAIKVAKCNVLVATPGRLLDLHRSRVVQLGRI